MPIAALYAYTRGCTEVRGLKSRASDRVLFEDTLLQEHPNAVELQANRTLTPDFEVLTKFAEHRGRIHNGNIDRTDGIWQRILRQLVGLPLPIFSRAN